jgi:hypothetical protein
MAINPENWLAIEQQMEEVNHVLLQTKTVEETPQEQPHLLLISTHAAHGTSSVATFLVIFYMGVGEA